MFLRIHTQAHKHTPALAQIRTHMLAHTHKHKVYSKSLLKAQSVLLVITSITDDMHLPGEVTQVT